MVQVRLLNCADPPPMTFLCAMLQEMLNHFGMGALCVTDPKRRPDQFFTLSK